MSPPTEAEPFLLACEGCAGEGCPRCGGWGRIKLVGCLRTHTDAEAWSVIEAAELAAKGSWPMGNGWLNEVQALVDGVRFVWREEQAYKSKMRFPDG